MWSGGRGRLYPLRPSVYRQFSGFTTMMMTTVPLTLEEVLMTKRELISHDEDKRYIRRDEKGRFTEDQVDVGRSLAADQRQEAKTRVKPGHGDRGDR